MWLAPRGGLAAPAHAQSGLTPSSLSARRRYDITPVALGRRSKLTPSVCVSRMERTAAAARNKGRRVSRNIRRSAGAGEKQRDPCVRIPPLPSVDLHFSRSHLCVFIPWGLSPPPPPPPPPPARGKRDGAPRLSANHVSEAFITHGFSSKTNTGPSFFPLISAWACQRTAPRRGRQPPRQTFLMDGWRTDGGWGLRHVIRSLIRSTFFSPGSSVWSRGSFLTIDFFFPPLLLYINDTVKKKK